MFDNETRNQTFKLMVVTQNIHQLATFTYFQFQKQQMPTTSPTTTWSLTSCGCKKWNINHMHNPNIYFEPKLWNI